GTRKLTEFQALRLQVGAKILVCPGDALLERVGWLVPQDQSGEEDQSDQGNEAAGQKQAAAAAPAGYGRGRWYDYGNRHGRVGRPGPDATGLEAIRKGYTAFATFFGYLNGGLWASLFGRSRRSINWIELIWTWASLDAGSYS